MLSPRSLKPLVALLLASAATASPVAPRQESRPQFGPVPYGVDLRSCTVPGHVAITYDDGPGAFTADLLNILDAAGAKATFFVVGTQVEAFPGVVRDAHARGHQIGSHTYTHADLETLSTEQRRAEVVQAEDAISAVLGFYPTYLRPPYTSCTTASGCVGDLGALGYHVANYDVDTKDYLGDYEYARTTYSNALASGSPQSSSFISLEHDIHEETVYTFTQFLIDTAKDSGYSLVTMGECLGDPVGNWYRNPTTGQAQG